MEVYRWPEDFNDCPAILDYSIHLDFFMNNRSIRILKVEYAEVNVVIICKIKPLIHKNVAFTRRNTTGKSLMFSIVWSYSNISAGKRVNLIICKRIPNSFFRERLELFGQTSLTILF